MTVVARWLFSEAASGTAPTTSADDTGNGNTLTLNYGTSNAQWTSDAGGNGFELIRVAGASTARATLSDISSNGNIGSSLANRTQLHWIIRVRIDSGESNNSWIFGVNQGGSGTSDVLLTVSDTGVLNFYWNDNVAGGAATFNGPFSGDYTLILSVDTTQASATDRCKMSIDGAAFAAADSCTIPQNETLSAINNTNRVLAFGNRPDGVRDFDGVMWYSEIRIDETLTDGNASSIHTQLAADHDAAFTLTAASYFQSNMLMGVG